MKKLLGFCFLSLTIGATAFAGKPGGGGGGCGDVPISWVFEDTTTSAVNTAIKNDGKGAYRGGVDGVFNSVIHYGNDCTGSRDATLGLNKTKKRALSMNFPAAIAGSDIQGTPSFAGNGPITVNPFLNVLNITGHGYVTPGVDATFYTEMSIANIKGPDGITYRLAFLPDGPCPFGLTCVDTVTNAPANYNDPVRAAWVRVDYQAAHDGLPDQWIVEGEFAVDDTEIQRGTLVTQSGDIHRGQYSMPFRIRITALSPLPQ